MYNFDKARYKSKKVSAIISKLEKTRDDYRKEARETSPNAINHKGFRLVDIYEASAEAYEVVLKKFYK